MKKLIVANYKMNPQTEREAVILAQGGDFKNVVIAPPFPFLIPVGKVLKKALLGAQDVSVVLHTVGPHTGEVSASMLKKLGVKYVILGHSERRAIGETDEIINKKVFTALTTGLRVILCVGEHAEIREKGIEKAKQFIQKQLEKNLEGIRNSCFADKQAKFEIRNLIIAYEPIWAISTTKNKKDETPEDAAEIIHYIKKFLFSDFSFQDIQVLYGGSVSAKNAGEFLVQKNINGLLVGGASLRSKEFQEIVKFK